MRYEKITWAFLQFSTDHSFNLLMNKAITYFLITLFVIQNTSNLWIVLSFYANRDYIAQERCINRFDEASACKGSCYLKEQLFENQKKEKTNTRTKDKEVQLYTQVKNDLDFEVEPFMRDHEAVIFSRNDRIHSTFIHSIFHPPRQVDFV